MQSHARGKETNDLKVDWNSKRVRGPKTQSRRQTWWSRPSWKRIEKASRKTPWDYRISPQLTNSKRSSWGYCSCHSWRNESLNCGTWWKVEPLEKGAGIFEPSCFWAYRSFWAPKTRTRQGSWQISWKSHYLQAEIETCPIERLNFGPKNSTLWASAWCRTRRGWRSSLPSSRFLRHGHPLRPHWHAAVPQHEGWRASGRGTEAYWRGQPQTSVIIILI